jgi:hypothetical protein
MPMRLPLGSRALCRYSHPCPVWWRAPLDGNPTSLDPYERRVIRCLESAIARLLDSSPTIQMPMSSSPTMFPRHRINLGWHGSQQRHYEWDSLQCLVCDLLSSPSYVIFYNLFQIMLQNLPSPICLDLLITYSWITGMSSLISTIYFTVYLFFHGLNYAKNCSYIQKSKTLC